MTPLLTPQGLQTRTLPELLESLKAGLRAGFGPAAATDPNEVLSLLAGALAPTLADVEEALQAVSDAGSPDRATGDALDALCARVGVTRKRAVRAHGLLLLTGTAGTAIPAGRLFLHTTGAVVRSTEAATLDSDGTALCAAEAATVGALVVAPGSITQIATPVAGLTAVTNGVYALAAVDSGNQRLVVAGNRLAALAGVGHVDVVDGDTLDGRYTVLDVALNESGNTVLTVQEAVPDVAAAGSVLADHWTNGQDEETDAGLRARREVAATGGPGNTDHAIRAAVLAVPGVDEATVTSNRSGVEDPESGQAPHTVRVVAAPPGLAPVTRRAVLAALWAHLPAGIATWAKEAARVEGAATLDGATVELAYNEAVAVRLYVAVTLAGTTAFPADGVAQVKAALVERVGRLRLGQPVRLLDLLCAVNSVPGVDGATLLVDDVNPPVATGNYSVPADALATLAPDDVDVILD